MRKSKQIYLKSKDLSASTEPSIVKAKQLLLALKKEFGARYFNALVEAHKNNLSIKDRISLFKTIQGKKSITQSRFISAKEDVKSLFSAISSSKSLSVKSYVSRSRNRNLTVYQRQKIAGLHNWINTADKTNESRLKYHTSIIEGLFERDVVPTTSGDLTLNLKLTTDPKAVGYHSYTSYGDTYSSRCKYRKTDLNVTITVPVNYISRIFKKGLMEVDGLYTLDASTPLDVTVESESMSNVKVVAATWLESGRGSRYNVKKGFIASGYHNDVQLNYHAKTLASAVRGLFKKLDQTYSLTVNRSELLAKAKKCDFPVSIADSYAAGNCESGTLSFVHRHGLPDTKDQTVPLSLLAQCAQKEPRNEVFAVILRILKRHRALTKPAKYTLNQ